MMDTSQLLTIGRLFTIPLQDHNGEEREIGQFEMNITLGQSLFLNSKDKPGMVKNMISHHLAHAIMSTEVPAEYWNCQLLPDFARELGIPETFSFRTRI